MIMQYQKLKQFHLKIQMKPLCIWFKEPDKLQIFMHAEYWILLIVTSTIHDLGMNATQRHVWWLNPDATGH